MTPKQKMKKAITIDKPHRAIALTDGWLCIKYLDGGEESLTTFADISEGDVITYGRSHPYNPQSEREKVLDEMLAALQNEGMSAWEERGYMAFIQSFRKGEP